MNLPSILFLTIFSVLTVHAQILVPSGITHGAEIELTNDWIYEADSPDKVGKLRGREALAANQLSAAIAAKCAQFGCSGKWIPGKWGSEFQVTLRNGWWFQVSYDPLCVEVQTKPSTLQELYEVEPIVEKLLFETAKEIGLFPRPNRSTHMNTGARSAFGYDVRSLFNYFVDNSNRPELASGVFRHNWNTAPPLTALGRDPSDAIADIQKKIAHRDILSFANLAKEIETRLYSAHPNPQYMPSRNQDLNFTKLLMLRDIAPSLFSMPDKPLERRGVSAVKSFHEFILHAELIETRIQWVKQQDGFLPFVYKKANVVTPAERQNFFRSWLREMDLPIRRYESLITVSPQSARKRSVNSCARFYR